MFIAFTLQTEFYQYFYNMSTYWGVLPFLNQLSMFTLYNAHSIDCTITGHFKLWTLGWIFKNKFVLFFWNFRIAKIVFEQLFINVSYLKRSIRGRITKIKEKVTWAWEDHLSIKMHETKVTIQMHNTKVWILYNISTDIL